MYRLESNVKCSPNNYPWFNGFPDFNSNPDHNLNRFPICESFCLDFYSACENQQLCVNTDKGNYRFYAFLSHAGSRKMDGNTPLGEWNSAKHSMACSGPTPCSTLKQFFDVSFDYDKHDRVNKCFSGFNWIYWLLKSLFLVWIARFVKLFEL